MIFGSFWKFEIFDNILDFRIFDIFSYVELYLDRTIHIRSYVELYMDRTIHICSYVDVAGGRRGVAGGRGGTAAATTSQQLSHLARPLDHHAQGPNIPFGVIPHFDIKIDVFIWISINPVLKIISYGPRLSNIYSWSWKYWKLKSPTFSIILEIRAAGGRLLLLGFPGLD